MANPVPAVFVIDTSSIAEVRRILASRPAAEIAAVFDRLRALVEDGSLTFPRKVYDELKQGAPSVKRGIDHALDWAECCRERGVADVDLFDHVREVLRETPDLLDEKKASGPDEADPYVVGLALHLRSTGNHVTVITEDRNDTPRKTSVQSACGLMGIPTVGMRAFLNAKGIYKKVR